MSALSNISLSSAFLAPGATRAARSITSAAAGPESARLPVNRNDPVTPARPVSREQEQLRARHLRLVGDDAPARRQAGQGPAIEARPATGGTAAAPRDSIAFTVQLLSQTSNPVPNRALAGYGQDLALRKDSAQIGSDIYRRAGAEPDLLTQAPTFLSLAV